MMKNKVIFNKKNLSIFLSIFLSLVMIVTSAVFLVKAINMSNNDEFSFTKGYDCDIDDRNGLLISSKKSGASYTLIEEISDVFEVEFRALAKTAGTSDFTGITFSIVDVESGFGIDLSFEERIRQEYPDYETQKTGNSSKKVDTSWYHFMTQITYEDRLAGSKQGTSPDGSDAFRIRTDANTANTSASAFSKGNCTFTGDTTNTIRFGFDIYSNEIFYYNNNGSKVIFADLDSKTSLGRLGRVESLPEFKSYSVAVKFSGIKDASNAPAQIVLYSLNGQSLAGETFTNEKGAIATGTPKINNGVVGKKYTISTEGLRTVDVIDGVKNEFKGSMTVICPDNSTATLSSNEFTPTMTGTHKLVLAGEDNDGICENEVSYNFYVFDAEPETEIALDYSLKDTTIGKGASVYLPKANVYSQLTEYGAAPTLALTVKNSDGEVVNTLDCSKTNQVKFDDAGEYKVEYLATSTLGTTVSKTCKITVSDSIPVFELSNSLDGAQYNEIVTIPTAVVNGAEASFKLVYPSGATTSSKFACLKEVGEYYVRYTSGDYVYDLPFRANLSAASLFANEKGTTIKNNVSSPDYSAELCSGVGIEAISSGATANFVNSINISDNGESDVLVKFMFTPIEAKIYEFGSLTLTLADELNPEISISLKFRRPAEGSAEMVYVDAKTNDMEEFVYIKDSVLRGSFWGVSKYPSTSISIYYDNLNNKVLGSMKNGAIYGDGTVVLSSFTQQIIDLNNEEHVGFGKQFGGFPSGRVNLSVTFDGLIGSSANILMLEVDGQSLSSEYLNDATAPEIFVEVPELTNNVNGFAHGLPKGKVGVNYEFFNAKAIDLQNGACDYEVSVFYNNGTNEQRIFNHTSYGFVPEEAGEYILVYRAKDVAGNYAEKRFPITVVSALDSIIFDCDTMPTEGKQGIEIELASGTASGGSGPLAIEAKVLYEDETEITVVDGKFVPTRSGNYTIRVTLKDYFNTTEVFDYPLTVDANNKPVFVEAYVPTVLLAGREFTFAEWKAYDYTDLDDNYNPKQVPVTIKIDDETLTDGKWTPTLEENVTEQDFTVYFVAGTAPNESVETKTVKVLSASRNENSFFANYFYLENSKIITNSEGLSIAATADNAKASFINPIGDKNFSINFNIDVGKNNYSSLKINIRDSINSAQSVEFEIVKKIYKGDSNTTKEEKENKETTCLLKMNGKNVNYIAGSFYNGSVFELKYDYTTGAFTDYLGKTVCYAEDMLGNKIVGFDSGYIYISFELVGATITGDDDAQIVIKSICNQTMHSGEGASDGVAPVVVNEVYNTFVYGKEVIFKPAYAYDVISSVTEFKLTVKAPSGKLLLDGVDPTVENKISVEEYGVYVVTYSAKDANGKLRTKTKNVHCLKTANIGLEFEGEIPSVVNVDGEITIPKITVTGTTEECNVTVFLIKPTGQKIDIREEKITLTDLGRHRIMIIAHDDNGNTVVESFDVTVVE